jgi:hypothetical protein
MMVGIKWVVPSGEGTIKLGGTAGTRSRPIVGGSFCFQEADMDRVLVWMAAALLTVYGTLTALAGLGQLRAGRIQAWAAWGMLLGGLAVDAAAVLMIVGPASALWVLGAALAGIHLLALNNGFKMYGRIQPAHHLARLVISAILIVLTYLNTQ